MKTYIPFSDKVLYFLYNLLFLTALLLLSPYFVIKMFTAGKYRAGLMERFGFLNKGKVGRLHGSSSIWLHAVSVGEINAAVPLINKLMDQYSDLNMVISTVTLTGYKNALEKIPNADMVFFFPLDISWSIKRVLSAINPKIVIIIETEIWPNVLRLLHSKSIPTVLVNGRISSGSYKNYKFFRFFLKRALKKFSLLSMQSGRDTQRIIDLGADGARVVTTGNIKFDQEGFSGDLNEESCTSNGPVFSNDDKVFIAGSTHRGEEEVILNAFGKLKKEFPEVKLLLAPRHPERFDEVESLTRKKGFSLIRKTELTGGESTKSDVVLLDTIGELKAIYRFGAIVFIGGSLVKKGGQNLLEPAFFKKPVFFGPYTDNFPLIAKALLESGGGIEVKNCDELFNKAGKYLSDPALLEKAGSSAYEVVEKGRGAVKKNLDLIGKLLNT